MLFSIVVPTWNNLACLRLLVDSIRRHSAFDHQIIVHVNDGRDGSREWVADQVRALADSPAASPANRPRLDATFSADNIGICLAVNEAASLARHDYIVYLNDDMVCLPGWDTALARAIAAQPDDHFMLSGTMIEPRATGNPCVVVADFGDGPERFREADLLAALPGLATTDWNGATWPPTVVHRRWWFAVGGYSVEFSPGMSSDNDLAMKLWHTGCRRFIGIGAALVYHFQCKSTGRIVRNDGRRQFLHKWGMTQSSFDRHALRRGSRPALASLPDPSPSARLRFDRLRGELKRRLG